MAKLKKLINSESPAVENFQAQVASASQEIAPFRRPTKSSSKP
jgi:hypothetical protein